MRLHYYRTGNTDKRPLVLVQGFSDNGLCWTPTARNLESEYDVIMPDMRAHGLSGRIQPGQNVDMAADLAGLIRILELSSPVICGHSMGAMVTYQTGVRFPELTSALVLEDTPWWLHQPDQTLPTGKYVEPPIAKWAKNLANQTLDGLLYPMCESKKQLDPSIIDTMVDRMHSQEVNWLTSIQNIAQPVLLFAGNPVFGGIMTKEVVAQVRQLNPKVTIVNFPDVGHLIRFDKYAAFMDALWAFLKQLR